MKKTGIVFLLLAALFLAAGGRAEEEKVRKKLTANGLYFIQADSRYANNCNVFGPDRMKKGVKKINRALDALPSSVPVSLYLAENSRSHPIQPTFSENSKAYNYLKKNLHIRRADHLKYSTYRQFCEYFYATDHHWNHRGSYQGYKDVVRLLLGEEEPLLTPAEEVTLPVPFNGSFAMQEKNPVSREAFAFYRFDGLPAYETRVNDQKRPYGNMASYLKGTYGTDVYENHFAKLYGGDVAKVVLEKGKEGGQTLLLIGNSYSSPIKHLLTYHFNRVVCIDLRFYQQTYGESFSLGKAVKEYGVDQVLLLGDVKMFIDADHIEP